MLLTLVAFWPAGHLGFINLDDYGENGYVVDNPHVHSGINATTLEWAFTSAHAANWHPVTWLSHMLDYSWFGPDPAGHHWMNVACHTANALLLFIVMRRMTGKNWFAIMVALLFAVHPLRVESVAWVSERKDVLSGFFFLLTLLAWAAHAQHLAVRGVTAFWKSPFYWLALLAFAFGLMSKPMLVSAPVILLLLNFWPLNRMPATFSFSANKKLLMEVLPFVALALASCLVTIWAQSSGHAIVDTERLPLKWRLINVPLVYAAYLQSIFWPHHLSVFYPYQHTHSSLLIFGLTVVGLIGFTGLVWRTRGRWPWLFVGWSWFVIMLLPVIGLVQVGAQAMADRYTYLPSIGIGIIVASAFFNFAKQSRGTQRWAMTGSLVLVLMLAAGVRHQLGFWKDSRTLFQHALAVSNEDDTIRNFLANACRDAGDLDGAVAQYRAILRATPDSEDIRFRLAYVLMQQQKVAEAEKEFLGVLRLDPKNASAQMYLTSLLGSQKKYREAENYLLGIMLIRPGDHEVKNFVKAALQQNWPNDTLAQYLEDLRASPEVEAHEQAAMILLARNENAAAKHELEAALARQPENIEVVNHLAWLLATCPDEALRDAKRAAEISARAVGLVTKRPARFLTTHAAALASNGEFEQASQQVRAAINKATADDEKDLILRNEKLAELFRARQPFMDVD